MKNPYNPPTTELLSELPSDTRRLMYVGPVGAAVIVTGALFIVGLLLFAIMRFFQGFDPTPPRFDPNFNFLLVAGFLTMLVTCFVATIVSFWCFNFVAPRLGGIRYKVR